MDAGTEHMAAPQSHLCFFVHRIMDGANSFRCPNPQRNALHNIHTRTQTSLPHLFYPLSFGKCTRTRRECLIRFRPKSTWKKFLCFASSEKSDAASGSLFTWASGVFTLRRVSAFSIHLLCFSRDCIYHIKHLGWRFFWFAVLYFI